MTDEEELAAEEAKQHCHNEACERASATTHKNLSALPRVVMVLAYHGTMVELYSIRYRAPT